MRKWACRNRGHQFRRVRAPAKNFYFIGAANRYVSKLAGAVVGKVHVVCDLSGCESVLGGKWRLGINHLGFAGIFQRKPNFIVLWSDRNVGAEWAALRKLVEHLIRLNVN